MGNPNDTGDAELVAPNIVGDLRHLARCLAAIADGIERTGLVPAETASGGTNRPARRSCGSTGSRGTVESNSTTDAAAGLTDRSAS